MAKLTERDLQLRFFWERWMKTLLIPNYTPDDWYETDVFEMTVGGFFREFEIKLNKYDLAADAEKRHSKYCYVQGKYVNVGESKHHRLAKGDEHGPNEFWYIMPMELALDGPDIPPYAGVYGFEDSGFEDDHLKKRLTMRIVTRPKRLHDAKLRKSVEAHARGVCYYRMHRLYWQLNRMEHKKAGERAEGDKNW